MNGLYTLLSLDYGGLLLGIALLVLALLGYWASSGRGAKWSFAVLALVALVLALGGGSHWWRMSQLSGNYPPPGVMVDVGGYRMHVLAEGPDSGPAIVWLGGGHVSGLPVYKFHAALRNEIRSILVDRPGTGWSDTGPFPRSTALEAEEVMAALQASGEQGPFIFAGHSFGGLLGANIARRYPDVTAGVVMMDATPLDIIFYGIDRAGLGSISSDTRRNGLQRAFGFYRSPPAAQAPVLGDDGLVEIEDPMALWQSIGNRPATWLTSASIFAELTPEGLIERAFETVVYDGELGAIPVYLVAPGEDPTTVPYAESVAGDPAEAQRFVAFLERARERYLAMSNNSQRIYAPAGTGHSFPDQAPEWLAETMRGIVSEIAEDWRYRQLTTEWPGRFGGLPPVDLATPESIEIAYRRALAEKRREVTDIAISTQPASFNNTVLALERSGEALARIQALLGIFTSTAVEPGYAELAGPLAASAAELEDDIAHNEALFARVKAVHEQLPELGLDPQAQRLVEVTYNRFLRKGADLDAEAKQRLSAINAQLAELRRQFVSNTMGDEQELAVTVETVDDLAGLPAPRVEAARAAAEQRGIDDAYVIPIQRPAVWPVLTHANKRSLREAVWKLWAGRGGNPGERDNRPVVNSILKLRGEKATLLGYPSFAHYQTAARMAATPEAAMEVMLRTWDSLREPTAQDTAALEELAANDGIDALEPWDRLYYAEKLRQQQFDFDGESLRAYLDLDNVVAAMIWAASELYGMEFTELNDVPVVSPDIRVFEVRRDGQPLGVLYMDMFARPGKQPSSWASQYRPSEDFRGRQLPVVALHSAAQRPEDGGPVLVPWERANVIVHEFGHTLHTLAYNGRYPSLGSLAMPWDFIEVPSLLNERWLADRTLLKRFMTHTDTGATIPDALLDRLEQVNRYNRVFSVTFNYLAGAIVDMRLHLLADGRDVDAVAVEQAVIKELGMPPSIDLILYVPHAFHTFSEQYAAGVYTYLWSDVIAADAAEKFLEAPGGLYDEDTAAAWRDSILVVGDTEPVADAYRRFRGADPDPDALLRRFGLISEDNETDQ